MSARHPNEISLEDGDILTDDSHEVARVWITDQGGSSVWISAWLLEDPKVFGYLMGDTIRHAARAYAGTFDMDEDEALQAIVDGVTEELREQVNPIETIQEGSLN
jgi:hypothetical protein